MGTKDIWDILGVIGGLAAGILIPVALVWVGRKYELSRQRIDTERSNADRIGMLLKHLASENAQERLLAVTVARHLAVRGQLPPEILSAIAASAVTDEYSGAASADLLGLQEARTEVEIQSAREYFTPLLGWFAAGHQALAAFYDEDRAFKHVESMAAANRSARDLLISNTTAIPRDLLEHARNLVLHYNDWLAGFREALSQQESEVGPQDSFDYITAPRYPFPQASTAAFREYLQS